MVYDLDNAMNSIFGSRKSNYTLDQIEEAKKRQKKYGGTILDNLEAITGKGSLKLDNKTVSEDKKSTRGLGGGELTSTIEELTNNLKMDFASEDNREAYDNPAKMLNSFVGLSDKIGENVFGQEEFIKKLSIAFKRPFVKLRDDNDALNSILITGHEYTGRHLALKSFVGELADRGVLKNDGITTIDLSLYPTATEEKLFLQDLYSAIRSKSMVIVFENISKCHVSVLSKVTELSISGEIILSERYIEQKDQLVSVTNALSDKTVGSLNVQGKYLIYISDMSMNKLADCAGTPFINSLGDVCQTKQLDRTAIRQIADVQGSRLSQQSEELLMYKLSIEDSFVEYACDKAGSKCDLKKVLDEYDNVFSAVSQMRLEREDAVGAELRLRVFGGEAIIALGEEEIQLRSLLPESYSGEIEQVKQELEAIVGLKQVKEYILGLEDYYGIQQRRRAEGLKAAELNKHMIFTGNPGTGKTTIARIVSKYLKAIGVLSGGQLVEVSRGDLVGRYAGHTAPLVNTVIKSALGGVLFIDEAYSLYRGENDSFGLEAIDTLVKGIEDNRDNLVVILAGYSKEMKDFLETNSGLKSRFPNIIDFPDYSGEELLQIGVITAKSKGYTLAEAAFEPLREYFDKIQATNAAEAGNGRCVRNKVEEAILNQSRRLLAEPEADINELTLRDFVLE